MPELQGYHVRTRLHSSGRTSVYRAQREADGVVGVLKYFDVDPRGAAEVERIKNEFKCLGAVRSAYVVPVHDLVFFDRGVGIFMGEVVGEPLTAVLKRTGPLDVSEFLRLAVSLTAGLGDIHQQRVIHRDLKPNNIVVNAANGHPVIIDFGIANEFSWEAARERWGSVHYMSPEQTGRMNRAVDLRTDLYSLGVVFYELLTGHRPFDSEDPAEVVHEHLAKPPPPLRAWRPALPVALERIVLRLLEKDPDARYQSAVGVGYDAATLAERLQRGEPLPLEFELGSHDRPLLLRIPNRLYGRDVELAELHRSFERARSGEFRAAVVSGPSGVGKSALARGFREFLPPAHSRFVEGKCEQYNRGKPYSAIVQMVDDLVSSVLREPQSSIAAHRENLLAHLAGEGHCLVEVAPVLEVLLGKQPRLTPIDPVSRQNRIKRAFEGLLRGLATREHPLVVFLDDLQWVDAASLDLLRSWLTERVPHVLLILAYRDNEVGPDHPLSFLLDDELLRGDALRLRLDVLPRENARQLVADSLHTSLEDVSDLASVLVSKTLGNPFFLVRMLREIHRDGLLRPTNDGYVWDLSKIDALSLTDNVVTFMTQQMRRYPERTRSLLNYGAVFGAAFTLEDVARVAQTTPEKVYAAFLPALNDAMLFETGGRFGFAHDKVHEAAYGLVDAEERIRRHHRVGRHLANSADGERVFEIVGHFNEALELCVTEPDRLELCHLEVVAGTKALGSAAFGPALELFETATALLPERAFEREPALAFDAHYGLASACYACAHYERCIAEVQLCLQHERAPLKVSTAVQLTLDAYFGLNRHAEAIELAKSALSSLGVEIPERLSKAQVIAHYTALKLRQGRRRTESLADLPAANDERAIAALGILNAMLPSAYLSSSNLYGYIAIEMARLSLVHGNTDVSPIAYACCMAMEAGAFKSIDSGEAYLRLAFAVNDRYPNMQQRGRIEFIRTGVSLHQTRALDNWEAETLSTVARNTECGALNFVDYTLSFTRAHSLFFGKRTLDEIHSENVKVLALHRKHGDREVIDNQLFLLATLNRWRGSKGLPEPDVDAEIATFDRASYRRRLETGQASIIPRGYASVIGQAEHYLAGDYVASLRVGLQFALSSLDLMGALVEHMHRFLCVLAYLAADLRALSPLERAAAVACYRTNRALLALFDRHAPNFRSHLALVRAEEHRRAGRTVDAVREYGSAIREGHRVSRFIELLAHLRLVSFYRQEGLSVEEVRAAHAARSLAEGLAFRAQVERLDRHYPELADAPDRSRSAPSSTPSGGTTTTFAEQLDLEALIRGAQAISREVRLDRTIEALLQQLCQISAAQRAILLLQEVDGLRVQGEMSVSGSGNVLTVLQDGPFPSPAPGSPELPETLVEFVARMRRTEVLTDATLAEGFSRDAYVQRWRLKSALCMPVLQQGNLLGVLYLENRLVVGAFPPEQREIIEILASQAAISVANARLYRELERKVQERTSALRQKTTDLETMLQNLDEGVFTILPNGTVHHEYSRQLENILGATDLGGSDWSELLFRDTTLTAETASRAKIAVNLSLGGERMWFELNSHQLVSELERLHPDGSRRTLELNWNPIVSTTDIIEKILVSVRDVTEVRKLAERARDQERDLRLIGQILAIPRGLFLAWLDSDRTLLDDSARVLSGEQLDRAALARLFRNMHTLKGNARTYGFDALAQAAHAAEERYAACRGIDPAEWDKNQLSDELRTVRTRYDELQRVYEDSLAAETNGTSTGELVDASVLRALRTALTGERWELAATLAEALNSRRLCDIVRDAGSALPRLARELDKPVPSLNIEGDDVRLRAEAATTLTNALGHLLRNAMDHGLESEAERNRCGKPVRGTIRFSASTSEQGCELLVRDDGRGLALEPLRKAAAECGLPATTDEDLQALVFEAGLSTAPATSEISGRGTGMDAMRRFIADLGGSVRLTLAPPDADGAAHRGFAIHIHLPRSALLAEVDPGDLQTHADPG